MAFDFQTFKIRAASAVVFGIIMLAALLGGPSLFFVLFAFIAFMAGKEFYNILGVIQHQAIDDTKQLLYGVACALTYMGIAQLQKFSFLPQINAGVNIYFGAAFLLTIFWMAMHQFNKFSVQLLLGYCYISLSFGLLAHCYATHALLPLVLIILIWINDTMQYIVGSFIGKTKMAPIISPKKTWEGTIGGSLLCIAVAAICCILFPKISSTHWLICGFVASVAGTLGDLLESKLKRAAGVKDSGNIMPGHGGALDRFDSLLLAAPVLWIVIQLIK
jgi:phosphatidate cytidylyltransferase